MEMIRNIVFDMGNVLVIYDPVRVCRVYAQDEEEIEWIRRELFGSEEWILLDKGAVTEEEAMERVRRRLPNERLRALADRCMQEWHIHNIEPRPGMEELVRDLKGMGLGIYLCSNASRRLRVYEGRLPGNRYFDGTIVSAEEGVLKPDAAIYKRLFEKYSLCPEECFFIDDLPANIEGGRACGMDGYCFADGDTERLRAFLMERLGRA